MNEKIVYTVEIHDPHAHQFRVTVRIPKPQAEQEFSLAAWIPGSYLIREFARHLSHLSAAQGRKDVAIEALDKARWRVACRAKQPLTLTYLVYAFDTSVRAAYLDAQRGFFNGTSLFVRVHGFERAPHELHLCALPKGWRVATALPTVHVDRRGCGQYEALLGFDELVDHPFELGPFWHGQFKVRGVLHEMAVIGALPNFDGQRLLSDAQSICENEIRMWHGRGKPPFKRYVFMLNAVEDGYGGLEHRASTALIASRKDLPRQGVTHATDGYVTLLGLISHEYFHAWNVKRLKPAAFEPYDYDRENFTQLLWFFEGFTSYYDDLLLLRSGLIDESKYLQLLAKTINQVLSTPGRHVQSLAQASWDAWIKYYRPDENTANATVSYYTKGALLGLCLDLTLRQHGSDLDRVMRELLALGRGISEQDVLDTVERLSNTTVRRELHQWVHSTTDLPVKEVLAAFGIEWQELDLSVSQRLGMKLAEGPAGLKVQHVLRGGLAEIAGVAAGDELIALDEWRVRKSDDLHLLLRSNRPHTLTVARDQRVQHLKLPAYERLNKSSRLHNIRLSFMPHADARALGLRDHWLARS